MHIWRSFSMKFNFHLFTTTLLNFFLPILYSFYLSVNEKLYENFWKPKLEIPKWTRLSIMHSLRVNIWGKLHFNSQKWGLFSCSKHVKWRSKSENGAFSLHAIIYFFCGILLFVLITLNNLAITLPTKINNINKNIHIIIIYLPNILCITV
mgnify:CR=1 FL=1